MLFLPRRHRRSPGNVRAHQAVVAAASRAAAATLEELEPRKLLASSLLSSSAAAQAVIYGPKPPAAYSTGRIGIASEIPVYTATATATPIGADSSDPSASSDPSPSAVNGVVYSNMGGTTTAVTVTGGEIGFDDYDSINNADINLTQFKFVGGVSAVGGTLNFDFYNSSSVFLFRLSASLGTAGNNFIWTLTPPAGITIPDTGFLHIVSAAGTTGTWRHSTNSPTIGTQSAALGSAPAGRSFKFELTNTINNTPPTIGSFTDSPDPIAPSGTVTLTANSVVDSDGTVTDVKFYRDTNGISGLQTSTATPDTLLNTDASAPYTFNATAPASNGTYTYYALATDNIGATTVGTTKNSVGFGSISGTVWSDTNSNKAMDAGEPTLSGWTVFLDQNRNQTLDAGEVSTTSNGSGVYTFSNLAPDSYFVTTVIPGGWSQTFPGSTGIISSTSTSEIRATPTPAVPEITTTGSTAPIHTFGGEVSPSDAQSNPLIRLTNFQADPRFSSINGSGFSVAVLDTGIDLNHPFFGPDANSDGIADRIVYQHDFANNDNDASDPPAGSNHGSNVASIVGSSDASIPGMAPAVNIIALKVFDDAGNGNFSWVEAALQWCVANAATYNLAAINMSLGDTANYSTAVTNASYGITDELAALAAQNVIVVSAAGNDFRGFGSAQGVSYPAADPNSLAVSAVWDGNNGPVTWGDGAQDATTDADRVTSFSQRSTTLTDIFAPGALITGANATGGTITFGGTSQAAPHIAGIAALADQLAMSELGRRLTMTEFRNLMINSGATIMDGDDENYAGTVTPTGQLYKRVDVLALGEAIRAMSTRPFTHTVNVQAGEVVSSVNFGNHSSDVTAPTADVVDVTPDPRQTAAGTVTINFSEPVTGVDLADFSLTRDGASVSLAGATLTPVTQAQYTLNLTDTYTGNAGKYSLSLNASGSGIQDLSGNALAVSASDDWLRNAVDGTAGNDTIKLVRSGGVINVFVNNGTATPNYTVNITNLGVSVLNVAGMAGNDTIIADFSGGVPAGSAGLSVNGGAQTTADTLGIIGTAASESATFNTTNFNFGATTIAYSATESFTFAGGSGSDTLNVNGGVFNFDTDANAGTANLALVVGAAGTVHFNSATQHLAALTVNGNADITAGGSKVLVTKSLTVDPAGKLNLRDNDMLIDYSGSSPIGTPTAGTYSGITRSIQQAYNFGAWNGNGITTTETNAANGLTTLGIAEAANIFGLSGVATDTFDGQTVDATTIMVKYTYAGDANLDGTIDGGDYGVIDNFVQVPNASGYANGDFNFDGTIDGGDYGIIDNNIQAQGGSL